MSFRHPLIRARPGPCATTHVFTALGVHNVLVTVRDDDGGTGPAVVRVVIFVPAEAWAISAGGLVNIAKTPHAVCPPDADLTSVGLLGQEIILSGCRVG